MTEDVDREKDSNPKKRGLFSRFGKKRSQSPAAADKAPAAGDKAPAAGDKAPAAENKASADENNAPGHAPPEASGRATEEQVERPAETRAGTAPGHSATVGKPVEASPPRPAETDPNSALKQMEGPFAPREEGPADESRFARLRRVFSRQPETPEAGAEPLAGEGSPAEAVPGEVNAPADEKAARDESIPGETASATPAIERTAGEVSPPAPETLPTEEPAERDARHQIAPTSVEPPLAPDSATAKARSAAEVPAAPPETEAPESTAPPEAKAAPETTAPETTAPESTALAVPGPEVPAEPLLPAEPESSPAVEPAPVADEKQEKKQRFGRIKQALSRTGKGLGRVFLGRKQIDDDLLEELETQLLTADLGFEVTSEVIEALTERVRRKELNDVDALQQALKALLVDILRPCEVPLDVDAGKAEKGLPFVLMAVGVNGVGKTTTIGKLAKLFLSRDKSVMLAAGDTFRAAAVEQLQVWGERNGVPVVAQHTGADSASVIYDAVESARARKTDLLIADTAGRLHTKSNLMDELKKIKRVLGKLDATAPHEVLLVLDAGTGQNAVNQLKQFHEAVGVTGIVLTKLDGTAKGGVIFALCRKFGIPVRYVGVGEQVEDLQPFRATDFVEALLAPGDSV